MTTATVTAPVTVSVEKLLALQVLFITRLLHLVRSLLRFNVCAQAVVENNFVGPPVTSFYFEVKGVGCAS
jgi:hypothetical protein